MTPARGLLLVHEPKDQGCHHADNLYDEINKIDHVVSAYALLGRIDGSVWIEAPDLAALTASVRKIQAMDGVRDSSLLIQAPDDPGAR